MTTHDVPDPNDQTDRAVLTTLSKLVDAADLAALRVGDYLLAVHDSAHWDDLTYDQLGAAMGCTKQAVNERIKRLLSNGGDVRRRQGAVTVDPNQLAL